MTTPRLATFLRVIAGFAGSTPEEVNDIQARLMGAFEDLSIAALDATKPIVRWATGLFPNSTGAPNQVMHMGHNVADNCAGRADPTKHGAWHAIEHEFETSPGGPRVVEFFEHYESVAGTVRRPYGATVNLANDECTFASFGKAVFASSVGVQRLTLDENGLVTLASNGALAAYYKAGNNTPVLLGDKTDATGVEMLRVDAANFIRVDNGQNYAGAWFTTPVIRLSPGAVNKIEVNVTGCGFNAATPIAKPTVTGSRGMNAALESLLTALANYGLITDSTTA